MEETPVEAAALQLAHRAGVAVRQNRLRTVGRLGEGAQLRGDQVDCFRPGDSAELASALGTSAKQGILQSLRMIDALQIARDFLAEKSIGERMITVASQLHG